MNNRNRSKSNNIPYHHNNNNNDNFSASGASDIGERKAKNRRSLLLPLEKNNTAHS